MECAGSLVESETPYSPNTDEAREGQAKHVALSHVPRGEDVPVDAIAARFQVDPEEIARAISAGLQAWEEIAQWMPEAKTEVPLDGAVTKGTADVLSVAYPSDNPHMPDSTAILDWKTGWSGDEHKHQLMAYADASRHLYGMPSTGYITAFEVWLRAREYRTYNFTADELDGFRDRAQRQLELIGKQYAAGPHCKFCPRQNQCQARNEFIRASVVALIPSDDEAHALTRDQLGALYERSKIVEQALRRYGKMLDAALDDGPIELPDGRALRLVTVERDEIQAVAAERILRDEFGWVDDELSEVLGVTKSGIERVAKSRFRKGGAAAAMRKILGRLREADAITKTTSRRKEIVG